jgi:hypothetical protein
MPQWLDWNQDLFGTLQYGEYCQAEHPLFPLFYKVSDAEQQKRELNALPITKWAPGDIFYLSYREPVGAVYYDSLESLEDRYTRHYVLKTICQPNTNKSQKTIRILIEVFGDKYPVDAYWLRCWAMERELLPTSVLMDKEFFLTNPHLLPPHKRKTFLKPMPHTAKLVHFEALSMLSGAGDSDNGGSTNATYSVVTTTPAIAPAVLPTTNRDLQVPARRAPIASIRRFPIPPYNEAELDMFDVIGYPMSDAVQARVYGDLGPNPGVRVSYTPVNAFVHPVETSPVPANVAGGANDSDSTEENEA